MGDSGALLLGFTLAAVSVQGLLKTAALATLVLPLLVLAVPVLDTSFVVAKRLQSRQPIYVADARHLHHRFMRLGFSQRRAVVYLWAWCATLALAALATHFAPPHHHGDWSVHQLADRRRAPALLALAFSLYVVYVLEIVKLASPRAGARDERVESGLNLSAALRRVPAGGAVHAAAGVGGERREVEPARRRSPAGPSACRRKTNWLCSCAVPPLTAARWQQARRGGRGSSALEPRRTAFDLVLDPVGGALGIRVGRDVGVGPGGLLARGAHASRRPSRTGRRARTVAPARHRCSAPRSTASVRRAIRRDARRVRAARLPRSTGTRPSRVQSTFTTAGSGSTGGSVVWPSRRSSSQMLTAASTWLARTFSLPIRTPVVRPRSTSTCSTGAPRTIVTPPASARATSASAIAPAPPSGKGKP